MQQQRAAVTFRKIEQRSAEVRLLQAGEAEAMMMKKMEARPGDVCGEQQKRSPASSQKAEIEVRVNSANKEESVAVVFHKAE